MPWLLTATLAIGAIAYAQVPEPSTSALEGIDAYAAMELANAWKGSEVMSFVTPLAVHFVFPDGQEVEIALPDDVMVVSVAPFLNYTHPCLTHYMSGCQGELVNEPFEVRAVLGDGTVVIDEVVPSMANGFIDLWLPRDLTIDLRLRLDGYASVGQIATFADSDTCVTTFQFAAAR